MPSILKKIRESLKSLNGIPNTTVYSLSILRSSIRAIRLFSISVIALTLLERLFAAIIDNLGVVKRAL